MNTSFINGCQLLVVVRVNWLRQARVLLEHKLLGLQPIRLTRYDHAGPDLIHTSDIQVRAPVHCISIGVSLVIAKACLVLSQRAN